MKWRFNSMSRYFENKVALTAIFLFFPLAAASNGVKSHGSPLTVNQRATSSAAALPHGPNMPPDPWDWSAANHGPNMPPDPWDWNKVKAQHGPNMPPDPWDWIISA